MTSELPAWTNARLILYHGTIEQHVQSVLDGVDLRFAQSGRDFGIGFYIATLRREAEEWAGRSAARLKAIPAVIAYEVSRDALASLEALWFVRGAYENEDFWSFILHCRTAPREAFHHARKVNGGLYDIVIGPVTMGRQRAVIGDYDQVSFHTVRAVAVLNACERRRVS